LKSPPCRPSTARNGRVCCSRRSAKNKSRQVDGRPHAQAMVGATGLDRCLLPQLVPFGTSSERNFEHCSSSPAANAALESCTHRRSQEDYHPPPSRSGHVGLEGSMVRDHSALILGETHKGARNELHACTHRRSQEDYHPPLSGSGHVSLEGSMVRDHSALLVMRKRTSTLVGPLKEEACLLYAVSSE
jgi:hypothetical protein